MNVVLRSRIPEVVAESQARAAAVVEKAAFDVEAGAKRRARVDTGFMRGEIRAVPDPDDEHGYSVQAGANYTIHHEFGTRHMSAQPMFVPAVEEVLPGFVDAMSEVYR